VKQFIHATITIFLVVLPSFWTDFWFAQKRKKSRGINERKK